MNAALCALGVILVVVAALGGVGALMVGGYLAFEESEWWAGFFGLLTCLLCLCAVVGGVRMSVAGSRGIGTAACGQFADTTGYETRYLILTAWDSGECYVRFGGNWVPKDQLWAEMGGRS